MDILLGIIAFFVVDLVIWHIYKCIVAIYRSIIAIYRKTTWRYETTRDVAKVVDKEYDDNFALQVITKTYPLGLYDEYNVYILYKDEIHYFNDKDLYKKVKVGDTVHILIHKGFNKCGELKQTYLSIED